MTVLNNFYTTIACTCDGQALQAEITINPAHEIFEGHFPGQPVVPGVCMIQIIKELMEQSMNQQLLFSKGHQIKFLQLLVPDEKDMIQVHASWKEQDGQFHTTADFKKNDAFLFKLSGVFSLQ